MGLDLWMPACAGMTENPPSELNWLDINRACFPY